MTIARFRAVGLAAALGIVALLPGHAARAAGGDWLNALSGPLAEAGYSLTWKSMSLDPAKGRVIARGLSSADAGGRVVARIDSLALDRPRAGPDGGWSADRLVIEKLEIPGRSRLGIQRTVVTRPDLRAVARLLATFAGSPAPGSTAPGGDAGPLVVERLEMQGLSQDWTAAGGERVATSLETLRVTGLRVDPAAFAAGGDPDRLRPLAVLAAVQVGLVEAEGLRSRSSHAGTTTVARQWVKNTARVAGRSGVLQYGNEGVRMQPPAGETATGPLLATLFPPDGEARSHWSGELSYDTAGGLLNYQQRTTVDGFGQLNAQADMRGVPNLTVGEWERLRQDDPRLANTVFDAFSLTLTDAGGVDRAIAAMSEDNTVPPAELRAGFATEFGAMGQGFIPQNDALLAAWLRAIQDFVRSGGTLALTATRPIPVAGIADRDLRTESLPGLVSRYGLSLQHR